MGKLQDKADKVTEDDNLLFLTVGLPRSGKSTWALSQNLPVVSPDAIRLALHGLAFDAKRETEVWDIAMMMVRSLFLAGHKNVIDRAIESNFPVEVVQRMHDSWEDVCDSEEDQC